MTLPFVCSATDRTWLKLLIRRPAMWPYYRQWRSSLLNPCSTLHDRLPWMTYEAIAWLDSVLESNMKVFEWGSGGSTFFFADRVQCVFTVEHDQDWFSNVKLELEDEGVGNVDISLHPAEMASPENLEFQPSLPHFSGLSFRSYARAIDKYPDNSFDMVVVDGRARIACARRAIGKIKPGGYLLVDNMERQEYQPIWVLVRGWSATTFSGPVPYNRYLNTCVVWQK